MGLVLYSLVFAILVLGTGLYFTRHLYAQYLPNFPQIPILHRYARLSTFSDDIESGLSSASFDLHANVAAGDSRAGLDDQGKREVQRIMRSRRVNFDEARRIFMQERFKREGIDADGRPRDPKFVSFS